jgi:hypothetical protein
MNHAVAGLSVSSVMLGKSSFLMRVQIDQMFKKRTHISSAFRAANCSSVLDHSFAAARAEPSAAPTEIKFPLRWFAKP